MLRKTLGAALGLLLLAGGASSAAAAAPEAAAPPGGVPVDAVQAPAPSTWRAALDLTNTYRARHQAPPVALDSGIGAAAQDWARQLADSGDLRYAPGSPYGQNMAKFFWSDLEAGAAAERAVELWYAEVRDYDFRTPGHSSRTGHFTQLVWASTRRVGFGAATDADGSTVVVAFYDPPGNWVGEFGDNVLPPVD